MASKKSVAKAKPQPVIRMLTVQVSAEEMAALDAAAHAAERSRSGHVRWILFGGGSK